MNRFKHRENLKNPINTASLGRWRERMSAAEVDVFRSVAGDAMAEYGYDLR